MNNNNKFVKIINDDKYTKFFKLKIDESTKIKINTKKNNNIILKKDIFDKFEESTKKIKESKLLDNKFLERIYKLDELELTDEYDIYKFRIFNINFYNSILIRAEYINNKFIWKVFNSKIEKIYDIPGKYNKHDSIVQNKVRPTIYEHIKDMSYCERQKFLRSYYLEFTVLFFDLLNDNGNVFISMFSFCDEYVIELIYILASMFDYIIIYDATYVYCDNFRGNKSLISKKDVKKFIKSDKSSITPKNNLKELLEYIERSYINKIEFNKLLLNKKYDEYIDKRISYMYDYLKEIHIDHKILNIFYKKMLTTLKKAFIGNKIISIHFGIEETVGKYISNTIINNNYKNCLEIGMGFGIPAFYILSNQNTQLISIDENQKKKLNNFGIKLLKEFNFDKRHDCYYSKSYEALPEILKKNGEEYFDFIYLDGWDQFDKSLVDFFYLNKLLRTGGIIIINDALHKGVEKSLKYIENNYKLYSKLYSPITIACYIKIKEDDLMELS
jgi:predicted O-methyltransferase YrrM